MRCYIHFGRRVGVTVSNDIIGPKLMGLVWLVLDSNLAILVGPMLVGLINFLHLSPLMPRVAHHMM